MQVERISDFQIGCIALHQTRTQASGLHRARLIGDLGGVLERAAQHDVAEQLRSLRLPQTVARHGGGDAVIVISTFQGVGDGHGELIFYQRADQTGPKTSFYRITTTAEPDRLREVLTLAHGQTGRVIKRRTLWLVGRTRVHLDRVEGLGTFMELEVVLREDEPAGVGEREAQGLMAALGISAEALIDGAYVDLLRALSPR